MELQVQFEAIKNHYAKNSGHMKNRKFKAIGHNLFYQKSFGFGHLSASREKMQKFSCICTVRSRAHIFPKDYVLSQP